MGRLIVDSRAHLHPPTPPVSAESLVQRTNAARTRMLADRERREADDIKRVYRELGCVADKGERSALIGSQHFWPGVQRDLESRGFAVTLANRATGLLEVKW